MSSIAEQVGRVVGDRYRLLAPIGSGASAQVFAAEDTRLGRRVAVKVLHPALARDESFLRRFRAEARLAASLDHPHVMRVFDWGEQQAGPYLVLELLAGGNLRTLLDSGVRLTHAQVASFGAQAAAGLAYAHRRGIIHRDIKPGNLLFDDEGHVRIGDFGVARAIAQSALTEPLGMVFGTARYSSPEQARGDALDDRTDVYSLALVLYESLTGRVPFSSDTVAATLAARLDAILPPARELGPLAPILAAAAIPEPLARLDAAGLASELEQAERMLPPAAPLPLVRLELGPHAAGLADRDPTAVDPGRPSATIAYPALAGAALAGLSEPVAGDLTTLGPAGGALGAEPPPGDAPGEEAAPPPRRRRRAVLLVVGLLVLLAGIVAGALAAVDHYVVYGHVVPKVEGDPVAVARVMAHDAGLRLEVTGSRYDLGVPKGDVITQSLRPGRRERAGTLVAVVESRGPAPVPVPSVTGDTEAAAVAAVRAGHLKPVVRTEYSETVPTGRVVSESPGAHSPPLARGSVVTLYVSKGPHPRIVTAVVGLPYATAAADLEAIQLKVARAPSRYSTTVPAGDVISETPGAHSSVSRGTTVTLTVSLGLPYVKVPQLFGQSVSYAEHALTTLGLKAKVYGPKHGYVVYENPGAGQSVRMGTTVQIATV